jgi:hypothetical protein
VSGSIGLNGTGRRRSFRLRTGLRSIAGRIGGGIIVFDCVQVIGRLA